MMRPKNRCCRYACIAQFQIAPAARPAAYRGPNLGLWLLGLSIELIDSAKQRAITKLNALAALRPIADALPLLRSRALPSQ
jgi:hypothetical protein